MIMKNKYFFLSNFYPCTIDLQINGKTLIFKSTEAAFQAQKNYELAEKFCLLEPLEAKRFGKKIPITTENWDVYRLYAMAKVLNIKFKDPELFLKLKEVKEEIVEDNYWNDCFWGVCKGKGKNMLGKLLMCIRDNYNNLEILYDYITHELSKELIS